MQALFFADEYAKFQKSKSTLPPTTYSPLAGGQFLDTLDISDVISPIGSLDLKSGFGKPENGPI